MCSELPVLVSSSRNADTATDGSRFQVCSRPGPGCVLQGLGLELGGPSLSALLPSQRPGRRLVYRGLTLGQELVCLLLSGWVEVKEAEES